MKSSPIPGGRDLRPPFDWTQHVDFVRPSLWQRLAPFVLLFVVAAALTAGLLMLAAERAGS